jgi:hypothetical protein
LELYFVILEKPKQPPTPTREYIPSKSELGTFSKKVYEILNYLGCTPI